MATDGFLMFCFATAVAAVAAGANGQEWLLILYCWICNHPINLTCDKGSLDALGKNITACNCHHHCCHWNGRICGEVAGRGNEEEWRWERAEDI